MKKMILTAALTTLLLSSLACSPANTSTTSTSTTTNSAATTKSPASAPASSPVSSPASSPASAASPAGNETLDFVLVNKTGYPIKGLYVGPTGTGDWAKEDEILKGKEFATGTELPIKFHPKATAPKWDIMVDWSDGSGRVEWLGLKLSEIEKVTLIYDKDKDKTSAIIE
jgi:hypothetical protein